MDKDEQIRRGVEIIKKAFTRYRKPEPALPPDSVIEHAVRRILGYRGIWVEDEDIDSDESPGIGKASAGER